MEIGSHWFRFCCEQRGLEPESTFLSLLKEHFTGTVRGPFNMAARLMCHPEAAENMICRNIMALRLFAIASISAGVKCL